MLVGGAPVLCAQTWDGGGSDNNWSTPNNWSGNTVPASNASTDVTFDGSVRLAPSVNSNRTQRSVTFASGAGAFTLGGSSTLSIGTGGITNNSTQTQTINTQLGFADHQIWNAANGAIVVNGYVGGSGKNLTLNGANAITFNDQLNSAGNLTVNGSGARTFNDYLSASTITIQGSGTTTLNGSGMNANSISVSGSGNTVFNTHINNSAYTQTGGNVTFSGTGDNFFTSFNVTGGSLHLNKSGGDMAVNTGQMNISNATLSFGANADNQFNDGWTDITLGDGAVLLLGDTEQTIDNLVITGSAIIDFGTGGSTFDVDSISFGTGSTLTIVNWNSAVDEFLANLAPGSALPQVIFADTNSSGTWGGGSITPGAPIPEPSTYGLIALGALGFSATWRRRRVRR